jgi:hypothetical protein
MRAGVGHSVNPVSREAAAEAARAALDHAGTGHGDLAPNRLVMAVDKERRGLLMFPRLGPLPDGPRPLRLAAM